MEKPAIYEAFGSVEIRIAVDDAITSSKESTSRIFGEIEDMSRSSISINRPTIPDESAFSPRDVESEASAIDDWLGNF